MRDASRCERSVYKDDRHELYEMRGPGSGGIDKLTVSVCIKCAVVVVRWEGESATFLEPPSKSLEEIAQRRKEGAR